jgi:hypothetical protein
MYKLITTIGTDGQEQEHIIRYNNNNTITAFPVDENNELYIEYQKWAAIEGNNIIDPGA